MGTPAGIFLKKDGKYFGIRSRYNGHPDDTGKALKQFYNTYEKANELISLGWIEYLGETLIQPTEKQYAEPEYTYSYLRLDNTDEDDVENFSSHSYDSLEELSECEETGDYNYVFEDGRWQYLNEDDSLEDFDPNTLDEILEERMSETFEEDVQNSYNLTKTDNPNIFTYTDSAGRVSSVFCGTPCGHLKSSNND